MKETFLNTLEDCQWLRETHLADKNLNNANPIPNFKSAVIRGNEDCPREIIVYKNQSPMVNDFGRMATLMDNGNYSFIRV
jgi:hypothetical protein